jgi:hypothetical protein
MDSSFLLLGGLLVLALLAVAIIVALVAICIILVRRARRPLDAAPERGGPRPPA